MFAEWKEQLRQSKIRQVLDQIREAPGALDQLKEYVSGLVETLCSMPCGSIEVPGDQEVLGIRLFKENDRNRSWNVSFPPPERIKVFGGEKLAFLSSDSRFIDVFVQIPRGVFLEKDFLNCRYFFKRNLYLQQMALQLEKQGFAVTIRSLMTCPYSPAHLVIESLHGKKIRVFACIDKDFYFKLQKLGDSVRNLRVSESESFPSRWYNRALRFEVFLFKLVVMSESLVETDTFSNLYLLLRLWIKQANLFSAEDHWFSASLVSPLFLVSFLQRLVEMEILVPGVSICTAIKICLEHFNRNLLTKIQISSESFQDFGVVWDYVSKPVLDQVTSLAEEVLLLWTDPEALISAMFLTSKEELGSIDLILRVHVEGGLSGKDPFGDALEENGEKCLKVLSQALKSRALSVHLLKTIPSDKCFDFAIQLKLLESSFTKIEKGPDTSSGSKEVLRESSEFVQFWGPKCDLRRFSDGSVRETIEFETNGCEILLEMSEHALRRHCTEFILSRCLFRASEIEKPVSSRQISNAFQALIDSLKSLEGIPLNFHSIIPTDPGFRDVITDVTKPLDVVLEFENHSKWPDHLPAIERILQAFLIRIALSLRDRFYIPTMLHVDEQNKDFFVDVVLSSITFRLRPCHARELLIRKAERDYPAFSKTQDPAQNCTRLALLEKECDIKVKQSRCLDAFRQKHPLVYSNAVLMLRRWLDAKHFSGFFEVEALELLVVFLLSSRWAKSRFRNHIGNGLSALYRFCTLFSQYAQSPFPIIVDLDENLTLEQRDKSSALFSKNKAGLFIASKFDLGGSVFTSTCNSWKSVLKGLSVMCKETLQTMNTALSPEFKISWDQQVLFNSPPLSMFDIAISISAESCHQDEKEVTQSPFKAPIVSQKQLLEKTLESKQLRFDPIQMYVQDIQGMLGSLGLVFFNHASRTAPIFVSLKRKREESDGMYLLSQDTLNMDVLVWKLGKMGQGVVDRVRVLRKE